MQSTMMVKKLNFHKYSYNFSAAAASDATLEFCCWIIHEKEEGKKHHNNAPFSWMNIIKEMFRILWLFHLIKASA